MTCEDFDLESKIVVEGHASPEMAERVKWHGATCVKCSGGTMPSYPALQQIFRDMFAHVRHSEVCDVKDCKHDDDPPSYFETEVVKQFKKRESIQP